MQWTRKEGFMTAFRDLQLQLWSTIQGELGEKLFLSIPKVEKKSVCVIILAKNVFLGIQCFLFCLFKSYDIKWSDYLICILYYIIL